MKNKDELEAKIDQEMEVYQKLCEASEDGYPELAYCKKFLEQSIKHYSEMYKVVHGRFYYRGVRE